MDSCLRRNDEVVERNPQNDASTYISKRKHMKKILFTAVALSAATSAYAQPHNHNDRPDAHAPIGVMRDHIHEEGEVMLSYRYGFMDMQENRDGSSGISDAQTLSRFPVAPTNMSMRMHMVGAMVGVTNQFSVGVMGGFATTSMDHIRRNGTTFETEGIGFTDTKLNGMYEFYNDGHHRFQANMGVSLPTGEIDERAPNGMRLPSTMQLGSGTYDLLPGVSYSGFAGNWSWGSQANAVIRTGRNNNAYQLGDRYQLTAWGARRLSDMVSVSARLDGQRWLDSEGNDRTFTGTPAPTFNPTLQAGRRVDALLGVNLLLPDGPLAGHRFALEAGVPIYEHLDRDRLGTDYRFTLGWQKAF